MTNSGFLLCFCLILTGCHVKYKTYVVGESHFEVRDSIGMAAADSLIAPYREALIEATQMPLIYSPVMLQKALPESAFGNLLADLLWTSSQNLFGSVDIAMLNYGGIRAGFPADTVRTGHVLEVLPFANNLHLVEMDSVLLQKFLNHWAQKGGTPMAGVRFEIANQSAVAVEVGNEPLSSLRPYRVVMPDYVANGGDGCGFLSEAKHQESSGSLLSDVIVQGLQDLAKRNPILQTQTDGRIKRK